MSPPLSLQFLLSAASVGQLPDTPAEVAFVGRSNVGKSSLLNALAKRNDLARVSKTPGRTEHLNCYALREGGTLVDCPGYGYAKRSRTAREALGRLVESYLLARDELAMVAVLVDGEIGPTPLDVSMLEWLRAEALPHSVVATKDDKVKSAARERRKRDLAAGCSLERGDITWVSASKGVGIDELRDRVRLWLA